MANRITQLPVEVLVEPSNQKARITQLPVEVLVTPSSQKARITQVVVEVMVASPTYGGSSAGRSWGYILGG